MTWILTYTGREVDPCDVKAHQVCLADIAHALSNTGRFCGHARVFWSVARHSLLAHDIALFDFNATPQTLLRVMLHDAAEAYVHDIATPLKRRLASYRDIETRAQAAVDEHFGIPSTFDVTAKKVDLMALRYERKALLPAGRPWSLLDGVPDASLLAREGYGVSAVGAFDRWADNAAVRDRFIHVVDTYQRILQGVSAP